MALTINPAVSGGHARWVLHATTFLLGALVGALVSAAAILAVTTLVQALLGPSWFAFAMVCAIVWAVAHDLGLPVPLPYRQQRVPRRVTPGGTALAEMLTVVATFAVGKTLVLGATIGVSSLEEIGARFRWSRWGARVLRMSTAGVSLSVATALLIKRW